jgi:hypothetical protein
MMMMMMVVVVVLVVVVVTEFSVLVCQFNSYRSQLRCKHSQTNEKQRKQYRDVAEIHACEILYFILEAGHT